jgi:DNA polymerase
MTQKDKSEQLNKVHQKWLVECNCELKNTATQGVPGEGNPSAELVFIGEAPGKSEDKEGRPFIGAAGKFLQDMLSSIKLNRADVYITNVVKYRPPNNRDPLPEEVASCAKWLQEELAIIQPILIILLGKHALERFFPGEKISQVHGKILKKKTPIGNYFFALYHPAAALYNGSMREVLMADFQKLPKVLEKISAQGGPASSGK